MPLLLIPRKRSDLWLNSQQTSDLIPIAIIGAGIGGSAAAIALRQAGFEVELFEQAPELREVGGAIVIREPSMVLLDRWGVLDALKPKMVAVNQVELRGQGGHILGTAPTAIEGRGAGVRLLRTSRGFPRRACVKTAAGETASRPSPRVDPQSLRSCRGDL